MIIVFIYFFVGNSIIIMSIMIKLIVFMTLICWDSDLEGCLDVGNCNNNFDFDNYCSGIEYENIDLNYCYLLISFFLLFSYFTVV
jgi:hypothetical protein